MTAMRNVLDVGSTVVVTIAAVAMLSLYVSDRVSAKVTPKAAPKMITTWEADNKLGIRIGPANASIVVTEFMDFQCPFCRRLVPVVDSLVAEFPEHIAMVFQHYPLKGHQFALPAAVAAECADRQGRFPEMYRTLFGHQESFGSRPWREYATEAGVGNMKSFEQCVVLPPDSFPRIKNGISLGNRTGVSGTPTVWVNGRVQRLVADSIRSQLKRSLVGRSIGR